MKQVDDLIERLAKKEYRRNEYDTTVISRHCSAEETAARQVVQEWVQDNFIDSITEIKALKQQVFILEEMVKKSTFAPMINEPIDYEALIEKSLADAADRQIERFAFTKGISLNETEAV